MSSPPRPDAPGVYASLANIVRRGSTPAETYAAICVAATMTVPGCDHASLVVSRDGVCRSAAVSDAVARQIDRLQLDLGLGPCLEAIETSTAQIESDLAAGARWAPLTEQVLTDTPVRGALSIRLPVGRDGIGALNLFSDVPGALGSHSLKEAVVLGAFATVASTASAHSEDVATLRRGLNSNRAIGQAIGMLMTLNNISDAAAFDLLRKRSQDSNVKLIDIATEIVRGRGGDKSA
ncbi:GAF and ANTAR domain-containing protein [Candidatus Mycobacterium wuenschmannii]|uniref:GAF and ANTAR domain-containing protein n=1 Tax=Candidatus Mycobacterium wuenschmannii TaxID=3027808 RepID=A0ABY8VUB5_9MYCO|nr:GAF and ANTAR domain-containing protein [Candidatus Mycobacterium wuenschmannii]WIM87229.1 GAF and ANTAR domain-containing protein [Candidatus Mycobacterium wuenschmannii]